MTNLIPFSFEGAVVRTINRNGDGWFILGDVCQVLEIANHRDAATRLDDDEKDGVGITDAIGRKQQMIIINESGLYTLIMTSRKEAAKRFRRWVTGEVLPSIRRTGSYSVPTATPETLTLREKLAVLVAHKRVFGPGSTRALWLQLGLPLADPLDDPQPEPTAWRDCLRHLVSSAGPLTPDRTADLIKLGLRLSDAGLTVANTAPDLFAGTEWAGGKHVAALRATPGAKLLDPVRFGPNLKVRATLVPLDVVKAILHEVGHD